MSFCDELDSGEWEESIFFVIDDWVCAEGWWGGLVFSTGVEPAAGEGTPCGVDELLYAGYKSACFRCWKCASFSFLLTSSADLLDERSRLMDSICCLTSCVLGAWAICFFSAISRLCAAIFPASFSCPSWKRRLRLISWDSILCCSSGENWSFFCWYSWLNRRSRSSSSRSSLARTSSRLCHACSSSFSSANFFW